MEASEGRGTSQHGLKSEPLGGQRPTNCFASCLTMNETRRERQTMSDRRMGSWTAAALLLSALWSRGALGQIVINEIVADERTASSGTTSETREFIELYNAGNSPVDISGYSMKYWNLVSPGSYYPA